MLQNHQTQVQQRKLVGWVIIMFSAKVSLFISISRSFLRYFLCFEQMVDAPECIAHEEIIWFWRNLMKLDSGRSINARDVICTLYTVSMERFTQHFSNNRANKQQQRAFCFCTEKTVNVCILRRLHSTYKVKGLSHHRYVYFSIQFDGVEYMFFFFKTHSMILAPSHS